MPRASLKGEELGFFSGQCKCSEFCLFLSNLSPAPQDGARGASPGVQGASTGYTDVAGIVSYESTGLTGRAYEVTCWRWGCSPSFAIESMVSIIFLSNSGSVYEVFLCCASWRDRRLQYWLRPALWRASW